METKPKYEFYNPLNLPMEALNACADALETTPFVLSFNLSYAIHRANAVSKVLCTYFDNLPQPQTLDKKVNHQAYLEAREEFSPADPYASLPRVIAKYLENLPPPTPKPDLLPFDAAKVKPGDPTVVQGDREALFVGFTSVGDVVWKIPGKHVGQDSVDSVECQAPVHRVALFQGRDFVVAVTEQELTEGRHQDMPQLSDWVEITPRSES